MTFIVGLGNPGEKYQNTRHNIGQKFLQKLFEALNFSAQSGSVSSWKFQKNLKSQIAKNSELILIKPETYMNESGQAVRAVLDFYNNKDFNFRNLYVIHDDLDLQLGNYKIQFGKGPKVHNGLISIYQHLGTDQFWHVRIGIDNRDLNRSIPPEKYVLGKFLSAEQQIIENKTKEIILALQEKIKNS